MKIIRGTIDCKEATEIPIGSVAFITVSKDNNIIGRQTLPQINSFPFKYRVEVSDDLKSKEAHETVQTWSIRVQIENGEETLFLNGAGNFMLSPHGCDLENLDIQLNFYHC